MRWEHPDKQLALWFMDEARVGQKGRTGHRWWLRGKRLPRVCTEAMNRFLADVSATVPQDTHAVMVLDGAGWRSWPGATPSEARWGGQRRYDQRSVTVPANVSLVALPAYSPELNPVERVWLFLRERYLSHRLFADYDAIVDACCRAWNVLTAEPDRLRSLCAYPYLDRVRI